MFEAMGFWSWILMGLFAGALARFLTPGDDPKGCLTTILIGVAGALAGGFIASYLGYGGISGFDVRSFLIATGGAVLLLVARRLFVSGGKKKKKKR